MQHNSWEKDRELLSEAYAQVNEALPAIAAAARPVIAAVGKQALAGAAQSAGQAITDKLTGQNEPEDQEEGNILERLEEFMNNHPETVEGLRQIIIDFENIIDDINNLEAPDQMIDAVDLGLHLARLAPDTTRGSAL